MVTASQLSWIVTRMIGVLLGFQCLTVLPLMLSSGTTFFRFHRYSSVIVESDLPIPEHRQDTPENWRLMDIRNNARRQFFPVAGTFLVAALGSAYCLFGGRALQRRLLPPGEAVGEPVKPACPVDGCPPPHPEKE